MNEKIPIDHCCFVGPSSSYAKFGINATEYDMILVAHEGHWTEEGDMCRHCHYKSYEAVQADLGCGFKFRDKEYVRTLDRSFFIFERDALSREYSLVVPATGEEKYFEIYGIKYGRLNLLWQSIISNSTIRFIVAE